MSISRRKLLAGAAVLAVAPSLSQDADALVGGRRVVVLEGQPSYEQIAASNGRTATAPVTPAANSLCLETRRSSVTGGQSLKYLRLIYTNYYINLGVETNNVSSYTIEASIEIAAAPIPGPIRVTFGGANIGTVAVGAIEYKSDAVPASAFGWATFPAGTTLFVKDRLVAPGVGASNAYPVWSSYVAGTGEGGAVSDGASASQVMTSGVITVPPGGASTAAQTPWSAIVGVFTSPEVSLFLFGDSIAQYFNDTQGSGFSGISSGLLVRPAWQVGGRNIPWVNAARNSATAAQAITKRLALAKYATHAVLSIGTNDIAINGSSAATTLGLLQTLWSQIKAAGVSRVEQVLLLPRTTSTDTWITTANQTPVTGFELAGSADTLNASIIAAVGANGLDGYINLASAVRDSVTTSAWAVNGVANGYTNDGIHPRGTTTFTATNLILAARYASYIGAKTTVRGLY